MKFGTMIADASGNIIIDVRGSNEQSKATARYIVESVNARHAEAEASANA